MHNAMATKMRVLFLREENTTLDEHRPRHECWWGWGERRASSALLGTLQESFLPGAHLSFGGI